jgi:glycine betaine transporter
MKNITSGISAFFCRLLGDVGTVFYISILIIATFVAVAASSPEMLEQGAQQVLDATATNLGITLWQRYPVNG